MPISTTVSSTVASTELVEPVDGMAVSAPTTVVEWVADGTLDRPTHVAVRCGTEELTYAQLDRRSAQVAAMLASHGVASGDLVAVRVRRSVDLVVALLGVLRAGCAYVPLDPLYPGERQAMILADTGARVVLVSERDLVETPGVRELDVADAASFEPGSDSPPAPDDLAYVIYTSGSTGTPKGVAIEHRSVVNLLQSFRDISGIGETDTLLSVTTVLFDIAGLELFLPLGLGATVAIATHDPGHDPDALLDEMSLLRPTIMQATPTLWRMLCLLDEWSDPDLMIICGGERLAPDLAAELTRRGGRILNVYGPTETTIWSTFDELVPRFGAAADDGDDDAIVSIGRPIRQTMLAIDTDHGLRMQPCVTDTTDQIGELLIGGIGLARGYWNRYELTEERFVWIEGNRWYRTGDLARWLDDGRVECLGRNDHQVKIRGHRVELGEIENVLRRHDGVADAVVVTDLRDRLVAYVVAPDQDPTRPSVIDLRDHAARSLPRYMVPDLVVRLGSVPLTPSGKVDRNALPDTSTHMDTTIHTPNRSTL